MNDTTDNYISWVSPGDSRAPIPTHCSDCGLTLEDRRTIVEKGYDPSSGIKRPVTEFVARACPKDDPAHEVWAWKADGDWRQMKLEPPQGEPA